MAIFLDRIDAAPIINSDFDSAFLQWLWVLVDSLNENLGDIQNAFNFLTTPNYTAAEITSLNGAGLLVNGAIVYDTTNHEYVGKQNGVLVKFSTATWP